MAGALQLDSFSPWLCHSLAELPSISRFTSLSFNSPFCRMERCYCPLNISELLWASDEIRESVCKPESVTAAESPGGWVLYWRTLEAPGGSLSLPLRPPYVRTPVYVSVYLRMHLRWRRSTHGGVAGYSHKQEMAHVFWEEYFHKFLWRCKLCLVSKFHLCMKLEMGKANIGVYWKEWEAGRVRVGSKNVGGRAGVWRWSSTYCHQTW